MQPEIIRSSGLNHLKIKPATENLLNFDNYPPKIKPRNRESESQDQLSSLRDSLGGAAQAVVCCFVSLGFQGFGFRVKGLDHEP